MNRIVHHLLNMHLYEEFFTKTASVHIVIVILFTKLPWPGDSEEIFRSSSQTTTCPPIYHTHGGGFILSL